MSATDWLTLLAALCIGLSKSGFSGISMVTVLLLAEIHGARASVGLNLPMLILADLLAYPAFRRHGSWGPVGRLLAPAMIGIILGWWLLGHVEDNGARRLIGACVLVMAVLQLSRRWQPVWMERCIETRGFGVSAGLLGGFATMMANAAGPVIQLYLMARKVPKMELIGIGARFFLLINLLKVPFMVQLDLINLGSLTENLKLAPAVIIGVFSGRWLIHHVPQRWFEWMVVGFSILAGVRLLLM